MTKMSKNFDTGKNLDQLEQKVWGEPEHNSSLVLNCHRLRKVPLNQFTTEDFRLMISQAIGLDFLIPPAIEILTENPLISGNYY